MRDYHYDILAIADYLESDRKLPKVKPERTLVAAYRHPRSHVCKFVELGEAAARVVEAARGAQSYQQLVPLAVSFTPELSPQAAVMQFLELVEDLQEMGIFVGSKQAGEQQ